MDFHHILLQTWQDGLETNTMLKEACGDNALGQTQTYEWFKRF
jgi:hypothetical protein